MFQESFEDAHDALADAIASARVAEHAEGWFLRQESEGAQPIRPIIDGVLANIKKVNDILQHELNGLWTAMMEEYAAQPCEINAGTTAKVSSLRDPVDIWLEFIPISMLEVGQFPS